MTTQHIETLIIGAGQAGLATGYHLSRLGRAFLVLDGNDRVGDNWRYHWGLRLRGAPRCRDDHERQCRGGHRNSTPHPARARVRG